MRRAAFLALIQIDSAVQETLFPIRITHQSWLNMENSIFSVSVGPIIDVCVETIRCDRVFPQILVKLIELLVEYKFRRTFHLIWLKEFHLRSVILPLVLNNRVSHWGVFRDIFPLSSSLIISYFLSHDVYVPMDIFIVVRQILGFVQQTLWIDAFALQLSSVLHHFAFTGRGERIFSKFCHSLSPQWRDLEFILQRSILRAVFLRNLFYLWFIVFLDLWSVVKPWDIGHSSYWSVILYRRSNWELRVRGFWLFVARMRDVIKSIRVSFLIDPHLLS